MQREVSNLNLELTHLTDPEEDVMLWEQYSLVDVGSCRTGPNIAIKLNSARTPPQPKVAQAHPKHCESDVLHCLILCIK